MTEVTKQFEDVLLTINNGIAQIVINRPKVLNAIRIQTYQDIIAALNEADKSDETQARINFMLKR